MTERPQPEPLHIAVVGPIQYRVPIIADQEPILLGRGLMGLPDDASISPRHAEIRVEHGRHVLRDLGSATGTVVRFERKDHHVLQKGDRFHLGVASFFVDDGVDVIWEVVLPHDSLTALPSVRGFVRELEPALSERQPLGLLRCDLDRFKSFNDTYGHLRGDRVLAETARALERALPDGAVLARTRGDVFSVLARGIQLDDMRGLMMSCSSAISEHVRENPQLLHDLDLPPELPWTLGVGALWIEKPWTVPLLRALDAADLQLWYAKRGGAQQHALGRL